MVCVIYKHVGILLLNATFKKHSNVLYQVHGGAITGVLLLLQVGLEPMMEMFVFIHFYTSIAIVSIHSEIIKDVGYKRVEHVQLYGMTQEQ